MVKDTGVERFSVSAPRDLINEFDDIVESLGQDRSKAIQQAMRLFLSEQKWASKSGSCAGAIVLIYDHEIHDAESDLTDLQHDFRDVINSSLHLHLGERDCLQIIAVKGECKVIDSLIEKVSTNKGVKQVKFTIAGI